MKKAVCFVYTTAIGRNPQVNEPHNTKGAT